MEIISQFIQRPENLLPILEFLGIAGIVILMTLLFAFSFLYFLPGPNLRFKFSYKKILKLTVVATIATLLEILLIFGLFSSLFIRPELFDSIGSRVKTFQFLLYIFLQAPFLLTVALFSRLSFKLRGPLYWYFYLGSLIMLLVLNYTLQMTFSYVALYILVSFLIGFPVEKIRKG